MFHLNSLVGTWAELLRVMPRGRKGGREEEGSKGEGDRGRGGRERRRKRVSQRGRQTDKLTDCGIHDVFVLSAFSER